MARGFTPTKGQRNAIVGLTLIVMFFALIGFGYLLFAPTLGTQLQGQLVVTYANGQTQTYQTASTLWDQLSSHTVISSSGGTINNLALNVWIKYSVTGASNQVTAQYWALYWVEITGPSGAGVRANLPIFGRVEAWIQDYGSKTMNTNRWTYLANGLGGAFGPDVGSYYSEKGSGLQVGNINLGPDMAVYVNQALGTSTIAGNLANSLTTILGTTTKSNGQQETVISWSKAGSQFFVDTWSIAYPYQLWSVTLPGGSACIPWTGYCAGAGAYLRLHDNDQYTIKFKAAVFYRWQDITGFWSNWRVNTITIATLNAQATAGYYTNLSVDVGGNVALS